MFIEVEIREYYNNQLLNEHGFNDIKLIININNIESLEPTGDYTTMLNMVSGKSYDVLMPISNLKGIINV